MTIDDATYAELGFPFPRSCIRKIARQAASGRRQSRRVRHRVSRTEHDPATGRRVRSGNAAHAVGSRAFRSTRSTGGEHRRAAAGSRCCAKPRPRYGYNPSTRRAAIVSGNRIDDRHRVDRNAREREASLTSPPPRSRRYSGTSRRRHGDPAIRRRRRRRDAAAAAEASTHDQDLATATQVLTQTFAGRGTISFADALTDAPRRSAPVRERRARLRRRDRRRDSATTSRPPDADAFRDCSSTRVLPISSCAAYLSCGRAARLDVCCLRSCCRCCSALWRSYCCDAGGASRSSLLVAVALRVRQPVALRRSSLLARSRSRRAGDAARYGSSSPSTARRRRRQRRMVTNLFGMHVSPAVVSDILKQDDPRARSRCAANE